MMDTVYIDIKSYPGTMHDIIADIAKLQEEHPDQEICHDGDAYAIVGIPRRARA